jgi:hypothetical protein
MGMGRLGHHTSNSMCTAELRRFLWNILTVRLHLLDTLLWESLSLRQAVQDITSMTARMTRFGLRTS